MTCSEVFLPPIMSSAVHNIQIAQYINTRSGLDSSSNFIVYETMTSVKASSQKSLGPAR